KAKEVTGKATGDKAMEHKGKVEKHGGKAQAAYGDLKHDIKESQK
ncbi:CsbD family protein, partial [Halomonas sp.]